jgi:hypothetical protein
MSMRSLGCFACPDEHPWQTLGGVPGSTGSRDGWNATDDGRLGHAWLVVFWRQVDDDEQQRMCNLVTWRSWWHRPGPVASGRDATSLALGGRREGPHATGRGRRQAVSLQFGGRSHGGLRLLRWCVGSAQGGGDARSARPAGMQGRGDLQARQQEASSRASSRVHRGLGLVGAAGIAAKPWVGNANYH